jgi:molecular chaperone DnaK
MNSIGIDFGTTNSVVAVYGAGGTDVLPIDTPPPGWENLGFDKVLPSVLGVGAGEEATFGWSAKTQATSKLEAVKRLFATENSVLIGGAEYSVEMAAALLFARLKQRAADAGAPLNRAVVTIPANSRGLARFRTRLCAGLAGIDVTALINEPTAAAMAHSISAADDQNVLVFDWGGGTLDVTALETVGGVFIERASKGIQRSGGLDLDRLFAEAVQRDIAGHERWDEAERGFFRLAIERAKVLLSSQEETNIELPGGGFRTVSRAELERAIRPKVEETRGPIDQCLRDLKISADGIDQLLLVGGSSKIPAVRQFVSEVLGTDPAPGADAMTAVAEGAAIAAAILAEELDADFFVATEHALGTISNNELNVPEFSVLIGRNHKLPAKARGGYRPAHAGQKSVCVRVIEGDPTLPLDAADNVILKEWDVEVDPSRPDDENGFTITYEYDVDGILHVTVTDDRTGDVMLRDDVSFGVSRDKAGLVELARAVRRTMSTGELDGAGSAASAEAAAGQDPATRAVLERVRGKIVPFVDDAEAQRLEEMCRGLERATGADVEERRTALEGEGRSYAYLF